VTPCHQTSFSLNPPFPKIARATFCTQICALPQLQFWSLTEVFSQRYGTSLLRNAPKSFLVCTEWRQVL
jgi:hypothetical protein